MVTVVGSVNVDHVVRAAHLPRAGETVLAGDLVRAGGGKGANAAVAAARLGAAVRLLAAVGRDDLGDESVAELARDGVGTDAVLRLDGEATGAALIVVDDAGDNQIAVAQGANRRVDGDAVRAALPALLDGAGALLVSCEVPLDGVRAAVALGAQAGLPAVLNPAPVLEGILDVAGHGPLLTPNAGEARRLTGEEDPAAAARALAARTGAPVLVTLGGDGVLVLATPDGEPQRLPVPALDGPVADTTGAGDTFNGALATELAAGASLLDAAAFAVRAASHAVRAHGARTGMPARAALG